MDKIKTFLILSLLVNAFLLHQLYSIETTNSSIIFQKRINGTPEVGVLHKEECPIDVTANRICRIEVVERRTDFASLKIHHYYVKGEEGHARIVVKANKGTHDNTVGTQGGPHTIWPLSRRSARKRNAIYF
ncbi:MAG: hypothetical protein ACJAUP_000540 [Cellvibrionaceae bacterium]|jgi:hypothetical protein